MDAGPFLSSLLHLDRSLFALINGADGLPLADAAMRLLSFVSSSRAAWLWLLLLALSLPAWRGLPWRRASGEFARICLLLALVYGLTAGSYQAIKYTVKRERPYQQEISVVLRGGTPPGAVIAPRDPSFPSGHAANAAMLGLLFARRWPRWRLAFALLAALAAISRVRLGVHYPLDVLAGALLAWGVGAALLHWLPPLRGLFGAAHCSQTDKQVLQ
jgi:undecaprenyl-diphosphatase